MEFKGRFFVVFLKIFQKTIDIYARIWYNIYRKEMRGMENIEKALRDLAKAVESNETVKRVTVTITMQKPKPSKATKESK